MTRSDFESLNLGDTIYHKELGEGTINYLSSEINEDGKKVRYIRAFTPIIGKWTKRFSGDCSLEPFAPEEKDIKSALNSLEDGLLMLEFAIENEGELSYHRFMAELEDAKESINEGIRALK